MHSPPADFVPISGDDVRAILADPSKLTLVAQPIIDIKRAVVAGYEILARFALGRPAPPDKVFAAAVQHGLGEQLEAMVVARGPASTLLQRRAGTDRLTLADALPA